MILGLKIFFLNFLFYIIIIYNRFNKLSFCYKNDSIILWKEAKRIDKELFVSSNCLPCSYVRNYKV
jgi:hypothetical protein